MKTEITQELIEFLQEMIKKYPNDLELGKEIRKFFYEIEKS